jgi:hypothetical protein
VRSNDRLLQISTIHRDSEDGPTLAYGHAAIQCPRCPEEWEGMECPNGCGVRVNDISARKDHEFMEQMRREEAERRRDRQERRALRQRTPLPVQEDPT